MGNKYKKPLIIGALFTICLFIFEFWMFAVDYQLFNLKRFFYGYEYLDPFNNVSMAIPGYFLTVLFVFVSLTSAWKYRIPYIILFCFAVLTEYGYQNASNRFSTPGDMATVFFAANWSEVSSAAGDYFFLPAFIPCLAFLVLMVLVKPVVQTGLENLLIVPMAFLLFYSFSGYVSTNSYPSISFNAFFRTIIAFPVNWYVGSLTDPALVDYFRTPRQIIKYRSPVPPQNNIVFIIDESMRGDHLGINGYKRSTTPILDQLVETGVIKNWGIAVSGTTCSVTSNNLLLTGVMERPDLLGNIYQFPTIFAYARAMGYKTQYFDGQTSSQWLGKDGDDFGNRVTISDLHQQNHYENDGEIGRRVKTIIEGSTGNFIWINKFGVHPPYRFSYPESAAKWLPVVKSNWLLTAVWPPKPEEIANDYDNAVAYNSQSFFVNLFDDGPAEATYYLYTSDHGQNLMENGRGVTHCSAVKNTANIPLFLIAKTQIMPDVDTNFKASHANIFATLLDMMNFPEYERPRQYAVSLFKAKDSDSMPRFYFEGNLNSRFSNGLYRFDK